MAYRYRGKFMTHCTECSATKKQKVEGVDFALLLIKSKFMDEL